MMVEELAQRIGVTPETVINWEKWNLQPIRKHLERLRDVLGLDVETTESSHGSH